MPDSIKTSKTPATVDTQDHQRAWTRQKETISSDPDGLPFSHYKASATDKVICLFDSIIRSLPYKFGFPPTAWLPMTDVMILKKVGVSSIPWRQLLWPKNNETTSCHHCLLIASLPKMGFVQTLPRCLVYGLEVFCILGVLHPWHNQHLAQLQVFIEELSSPGITWDLIRASMEQIQLEVGFPGSLLRLKPHSICTWA